MSHNDPPPSYMQATGSTTDEKLKPSKGNIPAEHRRSMEDETRELPEGWVRTYDPKNSHQFFVDTRSDPPRSIWHHPYDDEEYLSTLPSEERERIESLHKQPTNKDIIAMDTDEEDQAGPSNTAELPPRPQDGKGKGKQGYGRRLKDRLTGTTHAQREQERQRRQQEEDEAYRQHMHVRSAMTLAEQTGQPQYLGRDRYGHDVYLEPSYGVRPYQVQGQFINPYTTGIYQNPNNRFIRPQGSYGRPYGYGYGGGLGLPIVGGLVGGALLGGLLF